MSSQKNCAWGSVPTVTTTRPRWSCASNRREMAKCKRSFSCLCCRTSNHRLRPQASSSTTSCRTCYSRSLRNAYGTNSCCRGSFRANHQNARRQLFFAWPRIRRSNAIVFGRWHLTLVRQPTSLLHARGFKSSTVISITDDNDQIRD